MARPYRSSSGNRAEIAACAAAHKVGDFVWEGGWAGLCQATVVVGAPVTLVVEDAIKCAVPPTANQGDHVYAPGSPPTAGALLSSGTTTNLILNTPAGNTLVGKMLTPAVNGVGIVKIINI